MRTPHLSTYLNDTQRIRIGSFGRLRGTLQTWWLYLVRYLSDMKIIYQYRVSQLILYNALFMDVDLSLSASSTQNYFFFVFVK
jgi:hypothetical protein